ncbi:unnamed protein product [Plutella xylostella]|uniref:(diamondback moth) hypothetical protein n=1 Tax=Plutella xylostella TaxID=51655 RepID=A0A8S4DYD7_PLUXY|nr:unnamed protein product [Plutella xylostella]
MALGAGDGRDAAPPHAAAMDHLWKIALRANSTVTSRCGRPGARCRRSSGGAGGLAGEVYRAATSAELARSIGCLWHGRNGQPIAILAGMPTPLHL